MATSTPIIPLATTSRERMTQPGMLRKARYIGYRAGQHCHVWACMPEGVTLLRPHLKFGAEKSARSLYRQEEPTPAQLALAVLSHWSGTDRFALRYYQAFGQEMAARLNEQNWQLTTDEIARSIARICSTQKKWRTQESE